MGDRKMKKISSSGFPQSIDWDQVKEIEGTVTNLRVVTIGDQERRCLTLENEGEQWTIWESKGLQSLFDLNEGVFVQIKCLGMKKTKSGGSIRIFDVFADEGQLKIPF